MKNFFGNIFNKWRSFFMHPTPHVNAEEERRNQLVINVGIIISLTSAFMCFGRLLLEKSPFNNYTMWLLLLVPVANQISLLAIKYKNESTIPNTVSFIIVTTVIFLRSITTGGIYSAASFWLVGIAAGAILLLPKKQSFIWIGISIIALVLTAFPNYLGFEGNGYLPSKASRLFSTVPLFLMIALIFYSSESERYKNEKKIRESEKALADAHKRMALNKISGNIAHEINNPLAIINSHKSILHLLNKTHQDEKIEESLLEIEGGIKKIQDIVNTLRPFTKDDFFVDLKKINLNKVIENSLAEVNTEIKVQDIKISLEGPSEVAIIGTEHFTERVFKNLLSNSIESISNLSQKWIKIKIEVFETSVHVTFSDSGPSISTDVQQNLFSPFTTSKKEVEHSGLGLTISRNLMRSQRGDIQYDKRSQNATFKLSFQKASKS